MHDQPAALRSTRRRAIRLLCIACCIVCVDLPFASWSAISSASDWTRFQEGIASEDARSELPLAWSPTEHLAWTAEIPGYGQSSPVTWGDRVFVTSISGPQKEKCHVTTFDLATGKKLWQYDLESATRAENNGYISKAAPSPAVDRAGVYCFFEGGNLLALTHDGKVRWQRSLVEEFGAIGSRHGLGASLEQADDRLFVWVERSEDPYVLAVDKASGKDLWKVPGLKATSWSSPRLVPVKSGKHLVLSGVGSLVGLDPKTGQRLWEFDDISGNSTPTPVPVDEGRFLIGATVGRGTADSGNAAKSNGLIAIRKTDDGDFRAEFVWRAKRATSSFGSPIAYRGRAYFVNAAGVLYCLDLETGKELFAERLGESIWATPIAIGDRLGFFGKGGVASIVAAADEFEKLAENETWATSTAEADQKKNPRNGSAVLYAAIHAQGRLLLRRGDRLYCIASALTRD